MSQETVGLAARQAAVLEGKFLDEVQRLLRSGAVDDATCSRSLLFGVALENLADSYLGRDKSSREYRNLRRF
jgi:hypothetical protein